jgi:hypothetical protein
VEEEFAHLEIEPESKTTARAEISIPGVPFLFFPLIFLTFSHPTVGTYGVIKSTTSASSSSTDPQER